MSEFKDWLGQDIEDGDLVLYTTAFGSSSVETRIGRVLKHKGQTYLVDWIKTNKYRLPDKPTEVGITRLTLAPEGWALL